MPTPQRVAIAQVLFAEPHHHIFNIDTGELLDVPLDSVRIESLPGLPEETEPVSLEVMIKVRDA